MNGLIRLPALIVRPVWTALLFGVTSKKGQARKEIECRGPACKTSYRGTVAVFVSNGAYIRDEEDHAVTWSRCSKTQETSVRAACQEAYARKGRLYGLLNLTECTPDDTLDRPPYHKADERREKLSQMAGATRGEIWQCATWLHMEPIGLIGAHDAPTFKAACVGCNKDKPHNPAACHVNWQTVTIEERFIVEALKTSNKTIQAVKKESTSWHK